jgi:hypothetical protein
MDRATELALIRRLRTESYKTREDRLAAVKAGKHGTIDAAGFTVSELMELLPGRKIEWVSNTGQFTRTPEDPLWTEFQAIIHVSDKNLKIDTVTGTITFNDDEWQTRTVKISKIFTLTVRPIPPRKAQEPKRIPRHAKGRMNQKKLAV